MADDNSARYRSVDPESRGLEQPANDPLAELARLIGRSPPLPAAAREARPVPPPEAAAPPPQSEPPSVASDPAPRYQPMVPPYAAAPAAPHYAAEPTAPPYAAEPAAPPHAAERSARYSEPQSSLEDWPGSSPGYSPAEPLLPPTQAGGEPPPEPDFSKFHARLGLSGPRPDRSAFGPADDQLEPDRPMFSQPLYPQEPESGQMPPPHEDEFYDDAPRGNRRKGLLTVAAVLALAVVGTASAFGYRSFFGGPGSSAPAPVIRASGEPSKVAPPPAKTADQSASKFSYDRFGDRGKDEQVVVREEKPVAAQDLARSAVPRASLPTAPPAGVAAPAAAPSALGEPKRVRTVQIRPDQPEPATTPQSVSAVPPTSLAPQLAAPAQPAARDNARAAATPRMAARATPQPAPPPAPAGNAPLSLSPASNFPPPATARAAAPVAAPPPPRMAAAPAPAAGGGNGGYLVQVSSQRSEADAQSAYRSLSSKHSGVLGGQPHVIKRVDLGSKGVYYRAMIGPIGSRDQAVQLCSSLKAAGGECVVQSN